MKTRYEKVIEKNSVFCWLGFGTILLLLIPALGMLISNEIQWQIMNAHMIQNLTQKVSFPKQ